MRTLPQLFANNRDWVAHMTGDDPEFFARLARQQTPKYLWIGCSDSRVPANTIVGMMPGEIFVHRNVGNVVVHTDLNCLSVIEYAVEALQVEHVIVCGHYGCGGIYAALRNNRLGMIDNWLRHIQDIERTYHTQLAAMADEAERMDRLCELNVIEQVKNVCATTIVCDAWERGQTLSVHGWIYAIQNGLLRDLEVTTTGLEEARAIRA